jgi:hypothetical protein
VRALLTAVGFLTIACPIVAQPRLAIGVSLGSRLYEQSEKARLSPGADIFFEVRRLGVQVAGETTNLSRGGTLTSVHGDATYRAPVNRTGFIVLGAGWTHLQLEAGGSKRTWNAELQVGRRFDRAEAYVSMRQYSYSYGSFRNQCVVCANSPLVSLGVRIVVASRQ